MTFFRYPALSHLQRVDKSTCNLPDASFGESNLSFAGCVDLFLCSSTSSNIHSFKSSALIVNDTFAPLSNICVMFIFILFRTLCGFTSPCCRVVIYRSIKQGCSFIPFGCCKSIDIEIMLIKNKVDTDCYQSTSTYIN